MLIQVYGRRAVQIYGRDTPRTKGELDARWIRPRTKVLVGHFTYRQIGHLREVSGAGLITFVRDPVERFISNFYHFKSGKEHFSRGERLRRFEPLLIHVLFARYRNVMAQYLDGVDIDQLLFVGHSESFEEDVVALGRTLGWPELGQVVNGMFGEKTRVNDNAAFPAGARPVSGFARWVIRQVNRNDLTVYAKAMSVHDATDEESLALRTGGVS